MIDKAKPDLVMVTTVDSTHHTFITGALDRGIDVVTEKPMVTEASQCRSVLEAEKKNKRNVIVTFNYR
jgi:predicted dehydrogenase